MFWNARTGAARLRRNRGSRPAVEELERRLTPTTLPPGFTDTLVASGLSNPTAMEFAPDGRLFVLEQAGNVKLVRSDGSTWTALHLSVDSAGERGLLGIAFDPNFATNHFAYLYYTNPGAGGASWATGEHNQLSRFTVNDSNPQQPAFTSEAPILDWNNLSSAANHNGGAIHFGADGMLYADAGDNAQTFVGPDGRTYRVSQALGSLLGKQLRIDVSKFNSGVATRDDTTVGHLIPSNNPFVGQATGINQLIYALGLRNPYTFAVQPGTGRIFVNDVGENTWEEIDDSVAGGNYGWQGGNTDGFGHPPPAFAAGTYHDPLLAYSHAGPPGGIAIVGGTFYNPAAAQFPASYVGKYFYEDLGSGWIRVFDPANPGTASNPDTSAAFASGTAGGLRDLKVDAAGNLYYLAGADGTVHRIVYKVLSVSGAGRTFVGTTYTLRLTATEPPGSTVTGWTINWGDGAIQNVTGNPGTVSHVYGTGGPIYTLSATVTDQAGTYRVGGPRVEVLFPNPFQTMAALIYQAVLQRPIDAWGLAYWPAALASGLPRATMIADLMASTEYRSLLIDKLYRTYLARPADPLGLSLGLQFFQAGGTEVQYKALLLGTPEYLLTRGGGTNAGFLVALYQDVLGRALDPIGLANFGALLNSGVPRQVVAQALLGSAEADAVFVAGLYATYLHRPADAVGLGQLLSAMLRGLSQEQATVLILSTDEFIASF